MNESIKKRLKMNEKYQASFRKAAVRLEKLFYQELTLLQKARKLGKETLLLRENPESPATIQLNIYEEEGRIRALHNKIFDQIVADLEQLEKEHEQLLKQLEKEQTRMEVQTNGQDGD